MTGPVVQEPITWKERAEVAKRCTAAMEIAHLPTLIDGVDDGIGAKYAAWPDRLYLVGKNGRLDYCGGRGPRGFSPDELGKAIETSLGKAQQKK